MCIFFNKHKNKNTIVPICKLPRDYDIHNYPPVESSIYTPTELFSIVYDNIGESNIQLDKIINKIEFYENRRTTSYSNKLSDVEKIMIANAVIKCKNMQKINMRYYKP